MKTPRIQIIGAGMAGLLAANLLRRYSPTVIERGSTLPRNHTALLRFRTPAVSDATGIPFKQVMVRKGIWTGSEVVDKCTIPLANAYSRRACGAVMDRSIWNMAPEERWIAPEDFVVRMAEDVEVQYNVSVDGLVKQTGEPPTISTIPMPVSMGFADWDDIPAFGHSPIWTLKTFVKKPRTDIHQTIYNASHSGTWYRATLHGDELTVELSTLNVKSNVEARNLIYSILENVFNISVGEIGDVVMHEQPFGKIVPIDNGIRERFIAHLTDEYDIYSLGRFATWRPLLLDDLVKDVKVIETLISSGRYTRRLTAISK